MKRIFSLVILLILPMVIMAQWYGDGLSESSAYYGKINSSYPMQDWTTANYSVGVIYVGRSATGQYDLEIESGGSLTIGPGITVKFCTTGSDLRITGTGLLNAAGSSSGPVTFTKNSQASWGHISFEASTGSSTINYCIVEYGRKTDSGIEGYGGGIHANTSNLTISNSIIRYNYALWGGGIMVNKYKSPAISNCYVLGNQSGHGGGGFYFWDGSGSVVTNCIFDSNQCLELERSYYTGGGLATQSGCSVKVLNCTFVNNTSTQASGKSIMLYGSTADLILNCIVWGNTGYHFYNSGSSTINYCAVQGSAPSGTGNFVLSSNNNDATGPNFVMSGNDPWIIKFISPCRDKGTNSGTPTPPDKDYLGESRIYLYDIGAYEVQYSNWTGTTSTSWTEPTNWDKSVTPTTGTGDVVVPYISGTSPNYPTGSPNQDFTIEAGKQMIIGPGAQVTLNNLTNNGIIKLNSTSTGIASLLINSYSKGTGSTEEIQIFLTGGGGPSARWHYISSPVSSIPVSTFTGTTNNLAQYVESLPVSATPNSFLRAWIAYDDWSYYSSSHSGSNGFSTLDPPKGYDYYYTADRTYTFSGTFNTSNYSPSLGYSGVDPAMSGFNLLGNPYSSGLNWDAIISSPGYPLETSKAVFFTKNNSQYTYQNGVGTPLGEANGHIPPMQGFFVKTYGSGHSLSIPLSAREHNSTARYKGDEDIIISLIRLSLSENGKSDETVIRFDELAKTELDYDFDAVKMFLSADITSIYSSIGGTNFTINGLPFPDPSIEIPIVVNLITEGNHTIAATQLQGLDNYNVTLTDKTNSLTVNLKTTPNLSFAASAGSVTDRFILKISNVSTGTEDPLASKSIFNIYSAFNFINIQTLADNWDGKTGDIKVTDLTGKTVINMQKKEFSKNSIIQLPAPKTKGIYVVELKSGIMRYLGKVVIR